ncbi:Hypothetical predicted protein [Mytilus galloprovincialis]|uniref:Apple domain-containing protein n=1 Tax=Mytilus galloprovincialis TaxID=29158 RepID=A0A8B6EGC2_MYTGA|nr:Hypothetical predicted protein [Mytilus galloprovincialis]
MRLCIYQGLLLLYKLLQTSAEQCLSETFQINPDKRDVRLRGFTYRTFENISPRACFKKCIRRTRCHSYNYNRASLTCELNLKPMYISESYFKNMVGYVYVDVHHYREDPLFDPCVGNPCDDGEVCESLKNKKVMCILDECKTPTEAFQNVALGKMCGQSSTYNNEHAEYAVDGLTNTAPHTQQDQSPYWWVDLGSIYNIMRIEVINKFTCGSRLHDLDITVGTHLDNMSIFVHYTGPAADNEHLIFQLSRYTDGRYVKMTVIQGPEFLHVSEVIVIAHPVC